MATKKCSWCGEIITGSIYRQQSVTAMLSDKIFCSWKCVHAYEESFKK